MISDGELPALFRAADGLSLEAQTGFLRWTRARLLLAIGSSVFAGLSLTTDGGTEVAAVATVLALSGVFIVEAFLLKGQEGDWYGGRAAAESIKSLSWKYMTRTSPFQSEDGSRGIFTDRLKEVLQSLQGLTLASAGSQITETMTAIRSKALPERAAEYLSDRLDDQQTWYSNKAAWNKTRAKSWKGGLLVFEFISIVVATLRAAGSIDFDLVGIAGALIAAIIAWQQTKQYSALAEAYGLASHELGLIRDRFDGVASEDVLSELVELAEGAISREHSLWHAARSRRLPRAD